MGGQTKMEKEKAAIFIFIVAEKIKLDSLSSGE